MGRSCGRALLDQSIATAQWRTAGRKVMTDTTLEAASAYSYTAGTGVESPISTSSSEDNFDDYVEHARDTGNVPFIIVILFGIVTHFFLLPLILFVFNYRGNGTCSDACIKSKSRFEKEGVDNAEVICQETDRSTERPAARSSTPQVIAVHNPLSPNKTAVDDYQKADGEYGLNDEEQSQSRAALANSLLSAIDDDEEDVYSDHDGREAVARAMAHSTELDRPLAEQTFILSEDPDDDAAGYGTFHKNGAVVGTTCSECLLCQHHARDFASEIVRRFIQLCRYDDETKRILRLAIPFTFSALIHNVDGIIVLAMISRKLGYDVLSAYAVFGIVLEVASKFAGGIVDCQYVVVGHAYGADNKELAGQYVQLCAILHVLLMLPVVAFCNLVTFRVMTAMGFTEDIAQMSHEYGRIVVWSDVVEGMSEALFGLFEVAEHEVAVSLLGYVDTLLEVGAIGIALYLFNGDLRIIAYIFVANEVLFLLFGLIISFYIGWIQPFARGIFGSLGIRVSSATSFCH